MAITRKDIKIAAITGVAIGVATLIVREGIKRIERK